jgi:hypothetical protein
MSNSANKTADGVPISDGFDFPVGPRGDNVDVFKTHKIDTTLVDPAYYKAFGAWHSGEDWNGRGGGDTDLGDPIYAISHGRVAEFGYYPPSWGNIILLEHALPDGSQVWSQYAHLDQIMVNEVGQRITRGQQIGTMGKGAKTDKYPQGRWVAHLHFEIRRTKLPIDNWMPMVRDREQVLANYINPTPFINARRPQNFAQTAEAISKLQIVVDSQKTDPQAGVFRKADVDHWYSAPYGFQGTMLWTYASAEEEANWAEWRPFLPEAGQWEVWVYIPENHATTTNARYNIVHLDGRDEVSVKQNDYSNEWVLLGTYSCEPGRGYVRLSDVTGEQALGTPLMVGFDAVCWTKIR